MPTNGLLHLMQDSIVNIVNTKYESILNGYLLLHLKAVVREIIYQMFKAQFKNLSCLNVMYITDVQLKSTCTGIVLGSATINYNISAIHVSCFSLYLNTRIISLSN